MSYNIDTWKISKLKLELPLDFDFQQWLSTQPERDEEGYEKVSLRWCKERLIHVEDIGQRWQLAMFNQALRGERGENKLSVTELDWTDDFSGHLYHDILLPLFEEFHGDLEAIVVWERGDTIERLKIHDGVVEEEEIA